MQLKYLQQVFSVVSFEIHKIQRYLIALIPILLCCNVQCWCVASAIYFSRRWPLQPSRLALNQNLYNLSASLDACAIASNRGSSYHIRYHVHTYVFTESLPVPYDCTSCALTEHLTFHDDHLLLYVLRQAVRLLCKYQKGCNPLCPICSATQFTLSCIFSAARCVWLVTLVRMDYWGLNFGPGSEAYDLCR